MGLHCRVIHGCVRAGGQRSPGLFHVCVGKNTCTVRAKDPERPFPSAPVFVSSKSLSPVGKFSTCFCLWQKRRCSGFFVNV